LALFGVAYTTVAGQPIMIYWLLLAPFIGIVCVVTRWHDHKDRETRIRLIWTHVLHWGAVVAAMNLMFTTQTGYATLAVIALLEIFGVVIIRKIVNVRI